MSIGSGRYLYQTLKHSPDIEIGVEREIRTYIYPLGERWI